MPTAPTLSVIIPAKDREHELGLCLAALRRSDHSNYEVVIVDDGSRDGTARVAEEWECRVVSHEICRGAAAARNSGARAARGTVLLFIDSDVIVDATLLSRVENAFRDPETQAITGLLDKRALHDNFASRYDALYMHYQYWTHAPEIDIFYTSCAAIRRDLFLAHSGFDEAYKGAGVEDMEFGQRLTACGVRLLLNKDLRVGHAHAFTTGELLQKNARTASGTMRIMLRNRQDPVRGRRLVAPKWSFLLGIPFTYGAALVIMGFPWLGACAIAVAVTLLTITALLNRHFLGFICEEYGVFFMLRGIGMMYANYLAYGLGILRGAMGFAAGHRY